jgi:simple sugar transport system ATP-binding protein
MSATLPDVPALELTGIGKQFFGIEVLRDVRLTLRAGEVHALMGQNGAGKSTLIKVLTGVYRADAGQMRLDGIPIAPASPLDAQRLGINTVYQEVNLCPNLSVAENLFAGRYPRRGAAQAWRIDWAAVNERARALLARVGLTIDVTRLLSSYPVAVQQLVAIARALGVRSRVLILDEPTSSLDDDEVRKLFDVLRQLRSEGLAIVFVTHFMNQVYAISDRITVLRNGQWVGEWRAQDLPQPALIAAMLGRPLAEGADAPGGAGGRPPGRGRAPPHAAGRATAGPCCPVGRPGHRPDGAAAPARPADPCR